MQDASLNDGVKYLPVEVFSIPAWNDKINMVRFVPNIAQSFKSERASNR